LNQYCSEDPLKILFQQHRPTVGPAEMPQRSSLLPDRGVLFLSVESTGGVRQ
jgi:hypothetical protein